MVASFTDAWIETALKQQSKDLMSVVASFTDAWIETATITFATTAGGSHLLQMRGLKPVPTPSPIPARESHLLQMRGLKRKLRRHHGATQMSHLLQMRGLKRDKSAI